MSLKAAYADILLAEKLLIDIHQLNPSLAIASKVRELEMLLEDIHHQVLSSEAKSDLTKACTDAAHFSDCHLSVSCDSCKARQCIIATTSPSQTD